MVFTGGDLNALNGDCGISAPDKSVPIMKLIRVHEPKSNEELVCLIKDHFVNRCECGIISKGTVEDFGRALYNSQLPYWHEIKFNLQQCMDWEYDLFVIQSLKGNRIEAKAIKILSNQLNGLTIIEADHYHDEELRVDLLAKKRTKTLAGIQIKPISYKKVRDGIQQMNLSRNSLAAFPVLYLYYHYNSEDFIGLSSIVSTLRFLARTSGRQSIKPVDNKLRPFYLFEKYGFLSESVLPECPVDGSIVIRSLNGYNNIPTLFQMELFSYNTVPERRFNLLNEIERKLVLYGLDGVLTISLMISEIQFELCENHPNKQKIILAFKKLKLPKELEPDVLDFIGLVS